MVCGKSSCIAVRVIAAVLFATTALNAVAQTSDDEFKYVADSFTDEYRPKIEADSSIFYRAVQATEDIFADVADYDLSFVAFSRRGGSFDSRQTVLNGIPVRREYRSALRMLRIEGRELSGIRYSDRYVGSADGITEHLIDFSEPLSSHSANINVADRGYWVGLRAAMSGTFRRGWSLSAFVAGRTGRDMHTDGVFTNSLSLGASLSKHWNYRHKVSLTALFSPSERGMRRYSSEEAFTLTGDNLYNPSWGYQNGRMRNANVRRIVAPTIVATYDAVLSPSTTLTSAAGIDAGSRRYSSLAWFDAQTPLPDNYRYLPSYFSDDEVAADVAKAWRRRDPRYVQIDWDELCEQNRLAGGHSVYAVEDRTERFTDLHLRVSAATAVGDKLTIGYGIHFAYLRSRHFKRMRDLLGGEYITDIDQYLIDDAAYGNKLQNNVRDPNRVIREGDRFGYDYAMVCRRGGLSASLVYAADRFRFDFAAELNDMTVYRRGYYEKELFAGDGSFGRSDKIRLAPYMLKVSCGYSFTPRHYLELCAMAGGESPDAEDLFLQPQYNNRIVDKPHLRNICAAELNYTFLHRVVNLKASLFAVLTRNDCETSRYFDDLASVYSDMVVTQIDKLRLGVELAADIRMARHWRASLAVTAGRYTYFSDPRVSLYSDTDNEVICDRAVAHMGNCRLGAAPELAATADIVYMNKGWGVRMTFNYAGLRYVEPTAMRRTDRVSRQGSVSEETYRRFVRQERLPDAITADAAVWKSFRLRKGSSRIVVSLSAANVAGSRDIVYNGRESARVRRTSVAGKYVYAPFPNTYLYAYPRTFRLSVTYRF
ncbi:MAG: TonB-dependent receptor [Alistipes sp.]|nr:TonB-dependent receptor [Alistipes sp.]